MSAIANIKARVVNIYDRLMSFALSPEWLRVYYSDGNSFINKISDKYLHLSDDQKAQAAADGIVSVAGLPAVRNIATRLIRRHAIRAALVTFVATLPQNWLMWPLFAVDIVFFQKEIFLVTQEIEMLYGGSVSSFDYSSLATIAVKMEGVTLKAKAIGYAKRGFGWSLRQALRYCARIFRTSIRAIFGSTVKWAGIAAERRTIDLAINYILFFLMAAIAGAISYWLFVPMARRLERKLLSPYSSTK